MVNPNKSTRPEGFSAKRTLRVYPAARIGRTAQEILRAPDFFGTVLAVVTNAVYVTTRDGEILWLAQSHLPAHTRALLVQYDASVMRVGMQVRVVSERLMIGDVAIDLRDADEWQPPTIAHAAPLEITRSRVSKIRVVVARSREGIGDEAVFASKFTNEIFNHRNTQFATRNLIGLGAGLTPAGDDFVGGVLFAAQHLQKSHPKIFLWDAQTIGKLIEYARTQTNTISFTVLYDLARGQGPEPLHDFIVALLSEAKPDDLSSLVARVLAIGHSTGYAMIDGVLTGIELMMADTRKG